jgi:O-antigen/teichoic acid export membrane protein
VARSLSLVIAYDRARVTIRLRSLASSASWAVLDHALFSLAGMLASLLLARAMTPHAYGAYAVSFAVYVAIFAVHNAIFAEPMLVLSSHRFRAQIGSYLRAVLGAHVLFSLAVFAVLGVFAFGFLRGDEQAELRRAMIAMTLSAPFMNLAQLLRRLCYSLWTPREAAVGAALYLVVLAGTFAALATHGGLGLGSAYAALGASSLVASCGWLWRVAVSRDEAAEEQAGALAIGRVIAAHFAFARYGLGTSLLGWVPLNAWYVALPFVVAGDARLGASGHLRALVNLMQPMLQVNGALGTLLVPTFTKLLLDSKTSTPWRFTSIMTALAALYAPLLVLVGPSLNRWFYRGAYPADAATWWALGLVPACAAFSGSLRAYCLAREKPHLPLVATSVSALSCLTVGLALCTWRPLLGSSLAMLQGFALQGLTLAWLVRTHAMHRPNQSVRS